MKHPWVRLREPEGQVPFLADWQTKAEAVGKVSAGLTVYLLRYSVTKLVMDVLVSGDDPSGQMRGDAAAALAYEGGAELQEESVRERAADPKATTWTTTAGSLHASSIVHVVISDADGRASARLVGSAVASAVEAASSLGAESLAMPAFGTGTGGMSVSESGRVIGEALRIYGATFGESTSLKSVVVVLYKDDHLSDIRAPLQAALVGTAE